LNPNPRLQRATLTLLRYLTRAFSGGESRSSHTVSDSSALAVGYSHSSST